MSALQRLLARYIFGDATGDPVADNILEALRASAKEGLTEIRDLFGRHKGTERINQALGELRKLERSAEEEIKTLVCRECGEEFTVREGVEFELVAHAWAEEFKERGGEVYQETPADVLTLVNHEHSELSLINKITGERLFPWGAIYEK